MCLGTSTHFRPRLADRKVQFVAILEGPSTRTSPSVGSHASGLRPNAQRLKSISVSPKVLTQYLKNGSFHISDDAGCRSIVYAPLAHADPNSHRDWARDLLDAESKLVDPAGELSERVDCSPRDGTQVREQGKKKQKGLCVS